MSNEDLRKEFEIALETAKSEPDKAKNWDKLEDLAGAMDDPEGVALAYKDVLQTDIDKKLAGELGRRSIQFHQEWFGEDPAGLEEILQRVLEIDPEEETAFGRLSVILTVSERWDELFQLYDGIISVAKPKKRKLKLLDEAAQVAKDVANKPDKAIDYLKQLYPLKPEDSNLATSLEKLLEKHRRWNDLIELWDSRLKVMKRDERLATRAQIAECWLDRLVRPENALNTIHDLFEDDEHNEQGLALLERVVKSQDATPEVREGAIKLLRLSYQATERFRDFVKIIEDVLELFSEENQKELHREAGDLLSSVGDAPAAMSHFTKLLSMEPSSSVTQEKLRQLAEVSDDHAGYAKGVAAASENAKDVSRMVELLSEAAQTYVEKLNDDNSAIELYQKALAQEGISPMVVLSLGRRLRELLHRTDRKEELLDVLEKLASVESVPSSRMALMGDAARLARKLGDTERALKAWRTRLEENDADVDALDAMVALLEAEQRWEKLIDALNKRAESPVPANQKEADLVRIASIYGEQLEDPEKAIDAWKKVQETFGETEDTVNSLVEYYAKAERWPEMVDLLEKASEKYTGRVTQRLMLLGNACRDYLKDEKRSLAAYGKALLHDSRHEGAREGLKGLLDSEESRPFAAEALVNSYRENEEWTGVIDLVEPRLAAAADNRVRFQILREAADILENKLDNRLGALKHLARAFPLEPDNSIIEDRMIKLAQELPPTVEDDSGEEPVKPWKRVADAVMEAAQAAQSSPRTVVHLKLLEGRLYEDNLEDMNAAFAAYRAALELQNDNRGAAEGVVRLGSRLGRWTEAADAAVGFMKAVNDLEKPLLEELEKVAEENSAYDNMVPALAASMDNAAEFPPHLAFEVWYLIARWHRDKRDDKDEAGKALLKAVYLDNNRADALRDLATLQKEHPGKPLFNTLRRLADVDPDDLDAIADAAEVAAKDVGDRELTRNTLNAVMGRAAAAWRGTTKAKGRKSPEEFVAWSMEELVNDYLAAEEASAAVDLLVDASRLPFEESVRLSMRRRAGTIADGVMKDAEAAMELFRSVLSQAPKDLDAMEKLAELYEKTDHFAELLSLRQHELVHLEPDGDRRLFLRLEISRLVSEVEKRGGRVDALKQNLKEQPGHPETIKALVAVLDKDKHYEELVEVLTQQASELEGLKRGAEAAALWERAARVSETHLVRIDDAIRAYRRVVVLSTSASALDALARLYMNREEPAEAVKWLDKRLEIEEQADKGVVYLKLAKAHLACEAYPDAMKTMEEAFAEDASSPELRDLLLTLYRNEKKWEKLADLLVKTLPEFKDKDTVVAHAREAAEIYNIKLSSPEKAVPALEQATALVPDDKQMQMRLASGLKIIGRLDEARSILESIISGFGRRRSAERAEAHVELAIVAKAQGNMDEALEQLDLASKMAVGNAKIMRMVADAARDAEKIDKAEKAYRALLLVVRRQDAGDDEDAVGASEVLYELHRIANGKNETDQAKELLDSALETAASSDTEVQRLRRTLTKNKEYEVLLKALELRLEAAETDESRVMLLTDIADILETMLERPGDAVGHRLDALRLKSNDKNLAKTAKATAESAGALDKYVDCVTEVVDKMRRKDEAPTAADLLIDAGEILEYKLDDPRRACEFYKKAEQTGIRVGDALFALARSADTGGETAEQHRALETLRELALSSEPSPEQTDALYRLTELQVKSPEHRKNAIELLEKALESEPRYIQAAEILRTAAEAEPQNAELLEVYEPVARASGNWEILLDYLERRASIPGVTPDQVKEAVDLTIEHDQPARAETLYAKAVDAAREGEGGLGGAVWAVLGLIGRKKVTGDFKEAFELVGEISDLAEGEKLSSVSKELVQAVMSMEDPNLQLGASIYEFLRKIHPTAREIWEPLYDIYRKLDEPERLADLVGEVLPLLEDVATRNALRLTHAGYLIETGDLPLAVNVLRDALMDEPQNIEATKLMETAYTKAGDKQGLAEFLIEQFEAARESQNKEFVIELTPKLGTLLEELESPDALNVFIIGLEIAPDNPDIIMGVIERMDEDSEDEEIQSQRLALMERYLDVTEDEEKALPIAREIVQLSEASENDTAIQAGYELAHKACPSNEEFTAKLKGFYEEKELHTPLAKMYDADAQHAEDPETAVEMYRKAATIYLENLEDLHSAASVLKKAGDRTPNDPILVSELASVLAAAGDAPGAVEVLTKACEEDLEGDARLHPLLLRSEIRMELGLADESVSDLEEAYTINPEEVLPHLVKGHDQRRNIAAEADNIEAERGSTIRLAELFAGAGETAQAQEILAAWVSKSPDDGEALKTLRDLAVESGNEDGIITACSRLTQVEEGEAQLAAALTMAETALAAGREAEIKDFLTDVHKAQPEAEKVTEHLHAIYTKTKSWRELGGLIMEKAERSEDQEEKANHLKTAAGLYLDRLEDPESAENPVSQLRELDPENLDTALLYVDTLVASGKLAEASEVLDPIIDDQKRPTPELGKLLLRKSRLAAASGDNEAQMKHLNKAFNVARKDGEIAVEVAKVAESVEDYDLALKALRTISLGKKDGPITRGEAFLWEAKIEAARGNRAKALLQIKKALKEDPNMQEALDLKEELSN